MPPSFSITSNLSPSEIPRCLIISAGHEKTGLKPVFDNSAVCYDVVRHKGPDRLLRFACRLPPRLPPGRLRTIRYSNVHRTFELRSCPHGFESLLFSYEIKGAVALTGIVRAQPPFLSWSAYEMRRNFYSVFFV